MMVPGVIVRFANGEEMVVPPLTLGAMEVLQDSLMGYDGSVSRENIATITKATYSALKRNYPEITEDYVRNELLDLGNMLDVMQAVMDVGGLVRKAQEAADIKKKSEVKK